MFKKRWAHLDDLFRLAQSKSIYVMATLISFDHFKDYHPNYQRWRNFINSDANIDSYTNNYLSTFLTRYKNNPYLWSIDLINSSNARLDFYSLHWYPWMYQYWSSPFHKTPAAYGIATDKLNMIGERTGKGVFSAQGDNCATSGLLYTMQQAYENAYANGWQQFSGSQLHQGMGRAVVAQGRWPKHERV